jgi:hypothetical protein
LGADALSIDLSESLGALPAIHGVNGGPLVRKEWRKGSKQPTIDMSQEFAATQIPESRTHDDGSMDMQNLSRDSIPRRVDLVVTNPPYRPVGSGRRCADLRGALAREEIAVTLDQMLLAYMPHYVAKVSEAWTLQ